MSETTDGNNFCRSHAWVISGIAILMILAGCSGTGGNGNDTLSIAAVGPLTGAAAARGKDLEQAARMAVDEANADRGVNGHTSGSPSMTMATEPSRAESWPGKLRPRRRSPCSVKWPARPRQPPARFTRKRDPGDHRRGF